jgi:hypothetical protein
MAADAPYVTLDEMPDEIRDEIVQDVREYLSNKGYRIYSPTAYQQLKRKLRGLALADAAEIAMNAHGARRTCLQLAAQLKNMSRRLD